MFFGLLGAVIGVGIAVFLSTLLVIGAMLFVMARLCITMPVIMLEDQLNPITALQRSWQLTAQHQWPILGFWVVLGVAYFVIAILAFGIFSVVSAAAGSSVLSALILGIFNGALGALIAMIVSALVVAIYQQLAGDNTETISETFE